MEKDYYDKQKYDIYYSEKRIYMTVLLHQYSAS